MGGQVVLLAALSLWVGTCVGSPSERVMASLGVLNTELSAQVASRHAYYATAIADCSGKEETLREEVDTQNTEVRHVVGQIEAARKALETGAGSLMKLQMERGASERVTTSKTEELNAITKSLSSAEKNAGVVQDQHEKNIKSLEKSFGTIGGLIIYIQRAYQHQAALNVQLDSKDYAVLNKTATVPVPPVSGGDPASPSTAGVRAALSTANANSGTTEPQELVPASTSTTTTEPITGLGSSNVVVTALPVTAAPVTREPVSEASIDAVTSDRSTTEGTTTLGTPASTGSFKRVFSEIFSVKGPMHQHRHHQTVQELRDAVEKFQAMSDHSNHRGRSLLATVRNMIAPGKTYRQGMSEKIYSLLRKIEGMIKKQREKALSTHASVTDTNTKLLKAMIKQKAGVEVILNREAAKQLPDKVAKLESHLVQQKTIVSQKDTELNNMRDKLLSATSKLEDVAIKCKNVKASKATFDGRTAEQRSMISSVSGIISDRVSKVKALMDQKLNSVLSAVSGTPTASTTKATSL